MDKFIGADSLSHLYPLHVKPEGKQVSELASFLSRAEYVSVWNGPSIQTTSMEWTQYTNYQYEMGPMYYMVYGRDHQYTIME